MMLRNAPSRLLCAAALLLASHIARSEGEHWVPLYNKLARFVNERAFVAGETFAPEAGETQAEADARFLAENGVLPLDSPVDQSDLNALRQRIISLAEDAYVLAADPYQMALEPLNPEDPPET